LHAAKVNFYVVNGKKKCSQPQHFIYTPLKGTPTVLFNSRTQIEINSWQLINIIIIAKL